MKEPIHKVITGKKVCTKCKQNRDITEYVELSRHAPNKKRYGTRCKTCKRMASKIRVRMRKMEFVLAYGGKCSCCGEKHIEFLTVEHKNGDGNEHRKNVGRFGVYKDVKKQGYPKDKYDVLCLNCNWAQRNKMPCPHNTREYTKYIKRIETSPSTLCLTYKELYFKLKNKLGLKV